MVNKGADQPFAVLSGPLLFPIYLNALLDIWASAQEKLLHADIKGADQPEHLCSLISAIVIHYLQYL